MKLQMLRPSSGQNQVLLVNMLTGHHNGNQGMVPIGEIDVGNQWHKQESILDVLVCNDDILI
jgi:hypothetical protein